MGVDQAIDITYEQRRTILDLLERHLPTTEAWAYGSRAKWTARPQSDLDLVVFATPEQSSRVSDLREVFEESDLPFRIDMFVWDDVPESFRKQIEAEHVVLVDGSDPLFEGSSAGKTDRWTENLLGELTDNFDSVRVPVKQADRQPGPYPYYGASGIVDRIDDYLFDGEYLLIAEDGENLRTRKTPVAFLAHGKFWVNNHAHIVRGNHKGNTRYLMYAMSGLDISGYLTGSTMPKLTQRNVNRIRLRTPPLPEQRAIAHILGTLDEKIELNRRMNETLEAMARSLFKSWLVDFDPVRAKMEGRDTGLPKHIADLFPDRLVDSELGEIPEGWEARTLGDIVSLNPESWKSSCPPQAVSYVDLTSAKWGRIENVETYPWEKAPRRARRVLRKRDTIMATVRPGNGSFALIDEDGLTGSTGFAVLRPQNVYDRELVWCVATSSENIDRLAHLADGGAYPAIHPDSILATPVVLPDRVVRRAFSVPTGALLYRSKASKSESRFLADLRGAALPKLLSGGLRLRTLNGA